MKNPAHYTDWHRLAADITREHAKVVMAGRRINGRTEYAIDAEFAERSKASKC